MSVNKATILGNLGNDPQIKTFDNGGKVAQFAVATTVRGFTTKDGRQVPERTEWHNIVVHGKLAEVVEKYLFKGSKIYLEGELRTRNYTDQQNVTRYITEIHATTSATGTNELFTTTGKQRRGRFAVLILDYEKRRNRI